MGSRQQDDDGDDDYSDSLTESSSTAATTANAKKRFNGVDEGEPRPRHPRAAPASFFFLLTTCAWHVGTAAVLHGDTGIT